MRRCRRVFYTRITHERRYAAPDLDPGRYGFRGRARDADCTWFAEGCAEADLPHKGSIEIVLDRSMFPFVDASCVPGEQSEDPITGEDAQVAQPSDGGTLPIPPSDDDAGVISEQDSAVAIVFDPSAPKCVELASSVVSCLDFTANLKDASASQRDAVSSMAPSYEAALSGQGIRVAKQRVALEDDASLNVGAFTIEVWLRPDALVNLDDQVNGVSLLVDKDQQYNVGFTAQGSPRIQVYRGVESSETTTASDVHLKAGQFSYLAFSYDGSRSAIYKDGQRVDSEFIGLDLFRGTGGALHIGTGSPDVTRPFDGLIDALRISSVTLADGQICSNAGKKLSGSSCL